LNENKCLPIHVSKAPPRLKHSESDLPPELTHPDEVHQLALSMWVGREERGQSKRRSEGSARVRGSDLH